MVTLYIQKAKDRYIARELALLRASNPTPPMVSHLDEVDAAAIEEGVRRVIEARSQVASHAAASATVPPLSVSLCSSPLASQASCDPETQAMQDPSPSTSQASCDPETPAMQDPSPSASQFCCSPSRKRDQTNDSEELFDGCCGLYEIHFKHVTTICQTGNKKNQRHLGRAEGPDQRYWPRYAQAQVQCEAK